MARKPQNVSFSQLIPNLQDHELIIMCFQEMQRSIRAKFIERLNTYMVQNGFNQFGQVHMWEIHLIAFIKSSKKTLLQGQIKTSTKACGMGNLLGNKGAVQIIFNYNGKYFNIFGVHLLHGQNNQQKRDEMMEELIQCMKFDR